MRGQAGFTMIELIISMVLIGALAVAILPRMNARDFDEAGFRDGIKSTLQHARRTAVASRRFVCAKIEAQKVGLWRDTTSPEDVTTVDCGLTTLRLPAPPSGCDENAVCATGGVGVTLAPPATSPIVFDPLGRPVTTGKVPLTAAVVLNVAPGLAVTVQPESGAVQ